MHSTAHHRRASLSSATTTYRRLTRWFALSLCLSACLTAATAARSAPSTYPITDLGSLGYGVTDGYGIIKMSDLGTLGGINSEAHAINLSATVAGWSNTKGGGRDAFVKPLGKSMVDLGAFAPLAGWESRATGINDFGEIVGWFGFSPGSHAWLYSNDKMTELPDLSSYNQGGDSSAGGINNDHQIVGSSYDANGNVRAVLWQNGTITDLGTLGGPSAEANAINNLGQIVGTAATSTGEADFLDSNGTMTNAAANTNGSQPTSVNSSAVFVDSAAFIYSGGTLQNLNNLIPAGSAYQLRDATAINDKGQIVVNAYDTATYQNHALLLTPT